MGFHFRAFVAAVNCIRNELRQVWQLFLLPRCDISRYYCIHAIVLSTVTFLLLLSAFLNSWQQEHAPSWSKASHQSSLTCAVLQVWMDCPQTMAMCLESGGHSEPNLNYTNNGPTPIFPRVHQRSTNDGFAKQYYFTSYGLPAVWMSYSHFSSWWYRLSPMPRGQI